MVGQPVAQAESSLIGAGFQVSTNYVNNSAKVGTVISQTPAGSTQAAKGSTVSVDVSNGPSQVPVPNVIGQPLAQAANTLGSKGLQLGNVSYQNSPTVPNGDVISTNPTPGTTVAPNTPVDVVASNGPGTTTTTTAPPSSTTTTAAGG